MAKLSGQKAYYQPAELALIRRCWATYTAYYLGRVNISPAFPLLAAALGLSLGEVGWLGTVFFWAYGVGQLVHGQLGNVIRPRWMVLFGLVVIAVTNLLFAAQDALAPMLALWAMNGFAQAAGWGPMLRILNARFDERRRRHLATPFAMSFQVGTAASWGISVLLLALGAEWRALFWLPGIMLALAAFAWWRSGLDAPPNHSANPNANLQWSEITRELRTWWPYLFIAACTGFVYLGLLLWLPTLVAANVPLPPNWQRAQTALLPLLGVPGMLLAGRLLASGKDALQTTRILSTDAHRKYARRRTTWRLDDANRHLRRRSGGKRPRQPDAERVAIAAGAGRAGIFRGRFADRGLECGGWCFGNGHWLASGIRALGAGVRHMGG